MTTFNFQKVNKSLDFCEQRLSQLKQIKYVADNKGSEDTVYLRHNHVCEVVSKYLPVFEKLIKELPMETPEQVQTFKRVIQLKGDYSRVTFLDIILADLREKAERFKQMLPIMQERSDILLQEMKESYSRSY